MTIHKLTKKQIDQIINHTPEELRGKSLGDGCIREILGRFSHEDANWSYVAGWMEDGTLVVTRYGVIM